MDKWFQSDYCSSRKHCRNCRLSIDFRKWVLQTYDVKNGNPDFECPVGITADSVQGKFPPAVIEVANAAKALMRATRNIVNGKRVKVSDEERKRRLAICEGNKCQMYHKGRCKKCGCVTRFKAVLDTEDCPLGYWNVQAPVLVPVLAPESKTTPVQVQPVQVAPNPNPRPSRKAGALVIRTVKTVFEKPLTEACKRVGLELSFIPNFSEYNSKFRVATNIITWGVKIPTWWYHKHKANVLFFENGLLCQNEGIWIDSRGWFSESNLCTQKHYDEPYTPKDYDSVKGIVKKRFGWDLFQGGNPSGPIMYVVQSLNDAPCKYHYPAKANRSDDTTLLTLKLLNQHLPDKPLIIRPHPRFHDQWQRSKTKYEELFRPNWTMDNSKNIYETLKTCSAVVGVNSTVLTEALALGIPVGALGESAYTGSRTVLACARNPSILKNLMAWDADKDTVMRYLCSIIRDHQLLFGCNADFIASNREFIKWANNLK